MRRSRERAPRPQTASRSPRLKTSAVASTDSTTSSSSREFFFCTYFGQNAFCHVVMVSSAFLGLGRSRVYFINVVGTCNCRPRQSTPSGVARAHDAARDSRREGTIIARCGAAGFGAPALVPTVAISKPVTPGLLNSARSRVRVKMSCERAPAMFPHALIVVCAMRPASAPPPQAPLLGRLLAAPSPTTHSSRRGTCARPNQRPGHGRTPNTMRCSRR